jgi:hypothetical protein
MRRRPLQDASLRIERDPTGGVARAWGKARECIIGSAGGVPEYDTTLSRRHVLGGELGCIEPTISHNTRACGLTQNSDAVRHAVRTALSC